MYDRCCARYFPGPYDEYVEAKALAALASSRQAAALDKQRKHIEASISSAEKQARQVGGNKISGFCQLFYPRAATEMQMHLW